MCQIRNKQWQKDNTLRPRILEHNVTWLAILINYNLIDLYDSNLGNHLYIVSEIQTFTNWYCKTEVSSKGKLQASVGGQHEESRATFGALCAGDRLFTYTLAGVLGALRWAAAVAVTVARDTAATRRQTVVARRTERTARVGLGLVAGQLRLSGHILTARALTTDRVAQRTRRAQVVAVTRCTHPHNSTCWWWWWCAMI